MDVDLRGGRRGRCVRDLGEIVMVVWVDDMVLREEVWGVGWRLVMR